MATTYQRRPDGKQPDARGRDPRAALDAELKKLDEQKKALEKRGEGEGLDPELAAKLQPQMGNAALAGLLNRGTETAAAGEAALEEKEKEKDEEQEEEGDDKEAGEIEHVLPSFSTGGGGGGGGPGRPPWAMARDFGGDDDADPEVIIQEGPRWRPMPVLPDPDEESEVDAVEPDDAPEDDEDAVDMRGASVLGDAPWRPDVLSRGLRYAKNAAKRTFGPEELVDADGLDRALGRGRAMLRFLARYGEGLDAAVVGRAAVGAGEAVFAPAAGYSGATARALALVEIALSRSPSGWSAVLDIVADPRARARAEGAAQQLAQSGSLSAVALFSAVLGAQVSEAEIEPVLDAHPAAIAALELAARVGPFPIVDTWSPRRPPEREPGLAGFDAILARFTGAPPPLGEHLTGEDLGALFESMNQLLGAIGAALVESASAAVAASPYVQAPYLVGALTPAEAGLRRAARQVYAAGEATEALLGSTEHDAVRTHSIEAAGARGLAELARRGAFATIASFLLPSAPEPFELPAVYLSAEAEALAGRTGRARDLLDAALLSAPPEMEGQLALAAGGLLLRMGWSEDGRFAEAASLLGREPLAAAAHSLAAGLALARGAWDAAEMHGRAGMEIAVERALPYAIADAACTIASARAQRQTDWRTPLREAASPLRNRGEGAALNLLKARWAELEA